MGDEAVGAEDGAATTVCFIFDLVAAFAEIRDAGVDVEGLGDAVEVEHGDPLALGGLEGLEDGGALGVCGFDGGVIM